MCGWRPALKLHAFDGKIIAPEIVLDSDENLWTSEAAFGWKARRTRGLDRNVQHKIIMGSVGLGIQSSTVVRQLSSHARHLLHLLMLVLLATTANGFCPSKCICDGDANNLKAKCIDAGLDVVPIQLNPNVKHINLTDNKIATVHFTLSFYYQLETLDISSNALESLGIKNFVAQENLRKLYLQKNVIKKLSKDTFKGMRQLEVLDLSFNQISEMDPQTFSDLTRLSFLDLTNNSVISVESGVFQNLISLETLLFTSNQLLSVPYSDNFEYLRKLRRLDLSGNLIKQIENNSFQHISSLQTLHLSGNLINGIDLLAFDGLQQLQYLDLSDNNLTVSWGVFAVMNEIDERNNRL